MAKLPSSQDVRRSVPNPQRGIVSMRADQTGAALAGIGDRLAAIGQAEVRHEQETADRLAIARFESEMAEGYNDLLGSLREDGNYNQHVPKFQQGAQSLLQEKLQYINDLQQREMMALRAKEQISNLSFKVANNAHSMRSDAETSSWLSKADRLANDYSTLDPEQRAMELRSWQKYGQTLRDQRLVSPSKFAEVDAKMAKNVSVQELRGLDPATRLSVLSGQGKPLRDSAGTQVADDIIDAVIAETGLDNEWARFAKTVAAIESSGNPSARSIASNGKFVGLFQFGEARASDVGLVDRLNPEQSTAAFIASMKDYESRFKELGIEPTWGNLYLAHQQGFNGARRMIERSDELAVDVLGEKAVIQNGGNLEMTAGEFADKWRGKITGGEYNKYLANLDEDDRQSLINDTQKQIEEIGTRMRVADAINGKAYIDTSDSDQMKIFDNYFRDTVLPMTEGMDIYERNAFIVEQVANAGALPKSLRADMEGRIRAGSDEDAVAAADMYLQIQTVAPELVGEINEKNLRTAIQISESIAAGIPADEAVTMARMDLEIENKPLYDRRRAALKDKNMQSGIESEAVAVFSSFVPFMGDDVDLATQQGAALASDYKTAYERMYLQSGSEDAARKFAEKIVKGRYQPSEFNGGVVMQYAPEKFYAIPREDNDWMQVDFTQWRIKNYPDFSPDANELYFIQPDARTAREAATYGPNGEPPQPTYRVVYKNNESGVFEVLDTRYRPDRQAMINGKYEGAIKKRREFTEGREERKRARRFMDLIGAAKTGVIE